MSDNATVCQNSLEFGNILSNTLTKASLDSNVLVAEDNKLNCRLIQLMLMRLGYNASIVSNGLDVIRALEQRTYDLILLNIVLPEMDGFETARLIRRTFTNHSKPKIIAITAYLLPDGKEQCLKAGMDDYIVKPFTLNELSKVLSKYSKATSWS